MSRESANAHRLLKIIKPLHRAAGNVRDIDVLEIKVRSLLRRTQDQSFRRLLVHLKLIRAERADELVNALSRDRKTVRRCLKRLSKEIENQVHYFHSATHRMYQIVDELRAWSQPGARNLHAFRIRIKELCYLLQMMAGANIEFMKELEYAKAQIGAWHDWKELRRIAKDILSPVDDLAATAKIAGTESTKLRLAINAAQSLKSHYLMTHRTSELIEP